MALSQTKLRDEFRKLTDPNFGSFAGYPASAAAAAASWATAYDTYARDAVDASGDAVVTVNKPGFQSALTTALLASTTPQAAAAGFANAFTAYWTGAVFAVGLLPPPAGPCANVGGNGIFGAEVSSVVTVVNAAALQSALATEFQTLSGNGNTKAQALAAIFHSATTTGVTVLISGLDTTPPGSGPLPITNTCTIS